MLKKGVFSKILVCFIVIINVLFTRKIISLFEITRSEPTTLIVSWFAFTTGELGLLALIKKKNNGGNNDG